jgi:hypothetical protein
MDELALLDPQRQRPPNLLGSCATTPIYQKYG